MRRDRGVSAEISAAEGLAVSALLYLAEDAERLGRFLAMTGIDPTQIRKAAADRAFLAAVLEHISADERLLLAFAGSAEIAPAAVSRAQILLSGPVWERDTP